MTKKRSILLITLVLVVFLSIIERTKSSRAPSKQLEQKEEACRSQSPYKSGNLVDLVGLPLPDLSSGNASGTFQANIPENTNPSSTEDSKVSKVHTLHRSNGDNPPKIQSPPWSPPDGPRIIIECDENEKPKSSPKAAEKVKKPLKRKRNSQRTTAMQNLIEEKANKTKTCGRFNTSTPLGICSCRRSKCGYNVESKTCEDPYAMCSRYQFSPTECVRFSTYGHALVFYIYGGVACPYSTAFSETSGANATGKYRNCNIDETVLAVNLGLNQRHVDAYGIHYKADNEVAFKDPEKSRKKDTSKDLVGVDKLDQWLYRFQIWGDWQKKKPGSCVTYDVPLNADGEYELNLKMIDNYWRRQGARTFNVRLNGIKILVEVDIIHLTQEQYRAADFILKFEVKNAVNLLTMPGYPDSKISGRTIQLAFCFGECETADQDYHVAGFSIVRFVPEQQLNSGPACHNFRMLRCLCEENGCVYNAEYGDCQQQGRGRG